MNTLLNVFMSLGLFICSTHWYIPPSHFKSFSIHLQVSSINQELKKIDTYTSQSITLLAGSITGKHTYQGSQDRFIALMSKFRQLRKKLESITSLLNVDIQLIHTGAINYDHKRVKRGLFDFLGKASSYLFGLATTSDLDEIVTTIKGIVAGSLESRDANFQILNATTRHVQQNSEKIAQLSSQLGRLTTVLKESRELAITKGHIDDTEQNIRNVNDQLEQYRKILVSIRQLVMSSPKTPIGPILEDLFFTKVDMTQDTVTLAMISNSRLHSIFWDTHDIIINGYYVPIHHFENHTKLDKVEFFQQTTVGSSGLHLAIDYPIHNIVTSYDKKVLGFLDHNCANMRSSVWDIQMCPLIPFPNQIHECLNNLYRNNSIHQCPVHHIISPYPAQQLCNHKWLIDSTQVKCNIELPTASPIIVGSKTPLTCNYNGSLIQLSASVMDSPTTWIVPLTFLGTTMNNESLVADLHPDVASYELNKLLHEIKSQTHDWKYLNNLTSTEVNQYLHLASSDITRSKVYLESIIWRQYHKSFFETLLDFIFPILGFVAFGEINVFFLYMYFCPSRAHGQPISTVNDMYQEQSIIIGDYSVMITNILVLVAICFMIRIVWKAQKSNQHILFSNGVQVIPGYCQLFLSFSARHQTHGIHFFIAHIGSVPDQSPAVQTELDDCFIHIKQWSLFRIPIKRWIEINHLGLYDHGLLMNLPRINPLIVPLPRNHPLNLSWSCEPMEVVRSMAM